MTLVVARIVDGQVYCVGDTQLTCANNDKANPFLTGCIKQYVFNGLLVAFAGDVSAFECDIERFRKCWSIEDVVAIATKHAEHYDVLVASSAPSRIVTIKGMLPSETIVGFIGDSAAFEAFQRHFHNPQPEPLLPGQGSMKFMQHPEPLVGEGIYGRIYQAMKDVISDESIASVSGAVITIATHRGSFQYMMYCDVFTDEVIIPESCDAKPIGFGTKEGGGYSVEFSASNELDKPALKPAYYFLQGGFGVVFPERHGKVSAAQYIQADNPCQWALETKKAVGEAVVSAFLTLDHCGIEGEKYLAQNDYPRALACFELRLDSARLGKEDRKKLDRYFCGYYVSRFNSTDQFSAMSELADLVASNPDFEMCATHLKKMQFALSKG